MLACIQKCSDDATDKPPLQRVVPARRRLLQKAPRLCRTLEAYNFLQPKACFVYDDRIPGTAPPRKEGGKGGQAAGSERLQRRLLEKKGSRGDPAAQSQGLQQQQQQQQGWDPDGGEPQAGSYSAAILAALRSESSAAARVAVAALKEHVMGHNRAVAAAFMAQTEAQYAEAERSADAAWWRARQAERAAAAAAAVDGNLQLQPQPFPVQER